MTHHHPALVPANDRQRHLQLPQAAGAGVWYAPVDADFRGWVETQAQPVAVLMQTIVQVGIETLWIEAAKQALAGEITAGALEIGEFFTTPQGAAGRGQAVDETQALGCA